MSKKAQRDIPRLPRPEVPQAIGDVLTVQKPDGTASIIVKVARWRSMAVGQATTLHGFGQQLDGSTITLLIADSEPVTQAEEVAGWSRSINWEALQGLAHRSHLTFVFQAVLENGDCVCPTLFPPLTLEIQEPYEDRTTFSQDDGTDNWNGWMRGEAASDPRDLVVQQDGAGYSLFNNTSTYDSAGVLLKKSFPDLDVGRTYEFGVNVRRWIGRHEAPVLSLVCGTQNISPPTTITSPTLLQGTFTACSSQVELQIVSHVATGMGNDYIIHEIWVKSPESTDDSR